VPELLDTYPWPTSLQWENYIRKGNQ